MGAGGVHVICGVVAVPLMVYAAVATALWDVVLETAIASTDSDTDTVIGAL
jgi:hypothetical protein